MKYEESGKTIFVTFVVNELASYIFLWLIRYFDYYCYVYKIIEGSVDICFPTGAWELQNPNDKVKRYYFAGIPLTRYSNRTH